MANNSSFIPYHSSFAAVATIREFRIVQVGGAMNAPNTMSGEQEVSSWLAPTSEAHTCLISEIGSVKSSVISSVKTDDRILDYFENHPTGTVKPLSEELGLTMRAVEKHIAALKAGGQLIRTGSPRKGTWKVVR